MISLFHVFDREDIGPGQGQVADGFAGFQSGFKRGREVANHIEQRFLFLVTVLIFDQDFSGAE